MNRRDLKCPQCSSTNLECTELGVSGSTWKVTFGREFFGKEDLVAHACRECGFVFLQLEEFVKQTDNKAIDGTSQ
ncbi:MAG: hypothetical protein ACYTBS_24975 [Planctomycetota bacterium]|jgi:predicted nucleic-acid-binding Zn-ribbon protein